jgi:hypothetical protein
MYCIKFHSQKGIAKLYFIFGSIFPTNLSQWSRKMPKYSIVSLLCSAMQTALRKQQTE